MAWTMVSLSFITIASLLVHSFATLNSQSEWAPYVSDTMLVLQIKSAEKWSPTVAMRCKNTKTTKETLQMCPAADGWLGVKGPLREEVFPEEMSLQRFLKVEMDTPALIASGSWFFIHHGTTNNQFGPRLPCCRDGRTKRGSWEEHRGAEGV